MSGSEQDEELSAVTLIFGEDELEVDEGGQVLRMSITRDCGLLLCTFHLPRAYPGSLAPVLELSGAFSRDEAVWAEQELSKLFKPGRWHRTPAMNCVIQGESQPDCHCICRRAGAI